MTSNFPITITILEKAATPLLPIHRTAWRQLPFNVLVCNKNVYSRVTLENTEYIVEDGEAHFTGINQKHKIYWIDGNGPISVWCHFSVMLFHTIDIFDFYEIPLKITGERGLAIQNKCMELIECKASGITGLFRHETLAHELVALIISGCTEKKDAADKIGAINRLRPALDYMKQHLSSDFVPTRAASLVNLSASRFAAIFKGAFGVPPGAYWRNLRLISAYEMLYKNLSTPKETAEFFGFFDEFHFAKEFKRKFCITPAALLKKIRTRGRW